jgi:hypothetical protein
MSEINGLVAKNIMPYMGVQFDKQVAFVTPEGVRKFRVITYQAYNAYGLIGSEFNGVAILDEDKHSVLCDNVGKESTGYFGVSEAQLKVAQFLVENRSWYDFQSFVNDHENTRYQI